MTDERAGAAVKAAAGVTRLLLLLYPPSFRHDVGRALVDDVRRRAGDVAAARIGVRTGLWLVRLTISLLTNAGAAWLEKVPVPSASWLDVKLAVRMLIRRISISPATGFQEASAACLLSSTPCKRPPLLLPI